MVPCTTLGSRQWAPLRRLDSPEGAVAALEQGGDGSLDVGVGVLPAGLALVHSHAHLLPQDGWPVLGQPLTQLGQPAHEADHGCSHCEGVHAKVDAAGLPTGVDRQAEVALPARCLEDLQHGNSKSCCACT